MTPEQAQNASRSAKKVLKFIEAQDLAVDDAELMHIFAMLLTSYVVAEADNLMPIRRRLREAFTTVSGAVGDVIAKRAVEGRFSVRDMKEDG